MDRAPGRGSHKASESDELVRPGPEESGRPDEPLNFCPVCGSAIGRGAVPHEEHRVTSLTRRSVLWADRIAATSSSSGDVKSSSMCASGYSRAGRAAFLEVLRAPDYDQLLDAPRAGRGCRLKITNRW